MQSLLTQPQALFDALVTASASGTSSGCRPLVTLFEAEVSRWTDELEDLGAR
jgi:hypothetical protein